jgi:hypothetical protein
MLNHFLIWAHEACRTAVDPGYPISLNVESHDQGVSPEFTLLAQRLGWRILERLIFYLTE